MKAFSVHAGLFCCVLLTPFLLAYGGYDEICSGFATNNANRPAHCTAILCTDWTSPRQCNGAPHNSYEWIAYTYDACTDDEGSNCTDNGSDYCAQAEWHETFGCGDWVTCDFYFYTSVCSMP